MSFDLFIISLLNGLSYGLLLFLLSSGLTLIFGLMRVLNLAHGGFYMLGAYLGYSVTTLWGLSFGWALLLVPVAVGLIGVGCERLLIRQVCSRGHLAELILTYGIALVILALVQLVWGKVPVAYNIPDFLQGSAFSVLGFNFPRYRLAIMIIALIVILAFWSVLRFSSLGIRLKAIAQNSAMLEALGFNVPKLISYLFGVGCALAALAGVMGGFAYITEPAMAQSMGMMLFVVIVVGGIGSVKGALFASLLFGFLQSLAVAWDARLTDLLGIEAVAYGSLLNLSTAQIAPLIPFILMVFVLLIRPQGLFGELKEVRP